MIIKLWVYDWKGVKKVFFVVCVVSLLFWLNSCFFINVICCFCWVIWFCVWMIFNGIGWRKWVCRLIVVLKSFFFVMVNKVGFRVLFNIVLISLFWMWLVGLVNLGFFLNFILIVFFVGLIVKRDYFNKIVIGGRIRLLKIDLGMIGFF